METLNESKKFNIWYERAHKVFNIMDVIPDRLYRFGKKVGFAAMTVEAKDFYGNKLPGICFLRGDSVSILTVLISKETGKEYFVLTHQPRVPAGQYCYEAPAGMIDDEEVISQGLAELREEVGDEINPKAKDLIFLDKAFTSPGGSDEQMHMYLYKQEFSQDVIDSLQGKESGLKEEQITLKVIQADDFLATVDSVSSKYMFMLYKELRHK